MELTPDHLEILFRARMLGTNRGQVLEAWHHPEAQALAENGWLRRQFEPDVTCRGGSPHRATPPST